MSDNHDRFASVLLHQERHDRHDTLADLLQGLAARVGMLVGIVHKTAVSVGFALLDFRPSSTFPIAHIDFDQFLDNLERPLDARGDNLRCLPGPHQGTAVNGVDRSVGQQRRGGFRLHSTFPRQLRSRAGALQSRWMGHVVGRGPVTDQVHQAGVRGRGGECRHAQLVIAVRSC